MRKSKLLACWGGGALLAASVGTAVVVETATAAPSSSGTVATAGLGNGKGGGNNGNGGGNGAGGVTPTGKALTVAGTATDSLAPGATDTLTVSITNPNNQAVNIVSASATITTVGTKALPGLPACDKAWITVAPFSGNKPLAANATTTIPLTVSFDNLAGVNQDNCKDVTYTFTASATANQA